MSTGTPPRRRRIAARLLPLLVGACAASPPPLVWQRPDVSAQTAREVELDCRQHAIQAIDPAKNPAEAPAIHQQREDYFERCMRASGFELAPPRSR